MAALHISISAEKVAQVGPLVVSNSILTSLIVSALLIGGAFYVKSQIRPSNERPSGIQNVFEMIIEALYSLIDSVTGSQAKTRQFFPLAATFFFFIIFNNWLGLFPGVGTVGFMEEKGPGHAMLQPSQVALTTPQAYAAGAPAAAAPTTTTEGSSEAAVTAGEEAHKEEASYSVFVPYFRAGTADLNTTIALALISVGMTQAFGFSHLQFGYFKKFLNFSSPIMFFVGILEFISEIGKIVSFAFRLFGNIFAGEVLLAVIAFISPSFLFFSPMPFYGLEIFVGFVQALVFLLLSTVFFNMATISHDDH